MSEISTPSWFKTIVFLAILWNLAGIFNFYLGVSITPEQINELTESERNRVLGLHKTAIKKEFLMFLIGCFRIIAKSLETLILLSFLPLLFR